LLDVAHREPRHLSDLGPREIAAEAQSNELPLAIAELVQCRLELWFEADRFDPGLGTEPGIG
jgi:hypothetical protein